MSRRLPVYLLLDTSGSMRGEPIEAVKTGLRAMVDALRQDPHALDSVFLSIITFAREVTVLVPLTALIDLQMPEIAEPESGPTHTGMALEYLCRCVDSEVFLGSDDRKADWQPILFLMTDGRPSDNQKFNEICPEVKKRNFASIIACAAGGRVAPNDLAALTSQVYTLETMDGASFEARFKWVTVAIEMNNVSKGVTNETAIPMPPPELTPPY